MKVTKFLKNINLKYELVLVASNIRSRYNIGALFRIGDCVGLKKIYLCGISPAPPHPKIEKVSLGSEKTVPFQKVYSTSKVIKHLKQEGYKVLALEIHKKAKNIFNFHFALKTALVVGNEIEGVSRNILKNCDDIIFIPMFGKKESLNVSVSFAVASYIFLHKLSLFSDFK